MTESRKFGLQSDMLRTFHLIPVSALWRLCLLLAVLSGLGCIPEKPIQQHRVHKNRSGYEGIRNVNNRMLVGIFETETKTWFFKLLGPVDQVDETEASFRNFLAELEFENDVPSWKLPERWSDGGKRPMRHATLLVPSEAGDALEVSVSFLEAGQDMVLNANRWLGQLGLEPVDSESLDSVIHQVDSGNSAFLMFDATGSGEGKMMPGSPPPSSSSVSQPRSDVEFELIEGWQEQKPNSIVKVKLTPSANDADGIITVVRMPADLNDWIPNVQRWCDQVDMTLNPEKIEELTESQTIDGIEGKLIRLVDDVESEKRIIGVMIKKGKFAWFIKLMGSEQLVNSTTDKFFKFCESLKIPE